jgi:hypothetical protein
MSNRYKTQPDITQQVTVGKLSFETLIYDLLEMDLSQPVAALRHNKDDR